MESENSARWVSYVFLLATFFIALFILDRFFGLHYEPEEHRLNRKKDPSEVNTNSGHSSSILPVEDSTENSNNPSVTFEETKKEELPEDTDSARPPDDHLTENDAKSPETPSEYFENLKKKYLSDVVSAIPPNKARTDIIIRYYHHQPDGNSAYALQKLKFYIHERPVDSAYEDFQSNAIFYGDNVKNEDIQLVAYTLLNEGLPIKTIKPSQFHDTWKANSIEIGTDTTLVELPTLSYEEVKNFSR